MTEAMLQEAVLELAQVLGWRRAHFRPARVMRRGREVYETPVAADGRGFPDLVLVRDRVLFVELKSAVGTLSVEQHTWLELLASIDADAIEAHVWRPEHWLSGEIERVLRHRLAEAA